MQLEFHQLERRWQHVRVEDPERQKRLLASLAASGQQTPIVVVPIADQPDRYVVIDGYRRIVALEKLGQDTVEALIWPLREAEALVLDRSLHWSRSVSALEQGWLLAELEQQFGYSLEELARRFDRSVSWVSRRLALVQGLPESVQRQVRNGAISAQVAMKYLVPMARLSLEACSQMAAGFARSHVTSRQAGQLYTAWRDAPPKIRQRILEQPQLFLKVQKVRLQAEPPAGQAAIQDLLRDLNTIATLAHRVRHGLDQAPGIQESINQEQCAQAQRNLQRALEELGRLEARIPRQEQPRKENPQPYVESTPTHRDSGTSCPGLGHTPDRPCPAYLPSQRAQNSELAIGPGSSASARGESSALSATDPRAVATLQTEFSSGP